MLEINMLEPKGDWRLQEKWRGIYTIFHRPKGQMFGGMLQIHLWSVSPGCKSWYAVCKVHKLVHFKEN